MSLKQKTDYYGLTTLDSNLVLVSTTENKSQSTVEAQGEDGFVVAVESFGLRAAPTCEYVLKHDVDMSGIKMGAITAITGMGDFVLSSFEVSTQAGSAPTVSASGSQVEPNATTTCYAMLPAITIGALHHAQTFGAFTLSGAGAHLTQSTFSAQCEVSTAEKDGDILAHDIVGGTVTVSGTIQVSDPSYPIPTVTPANGWTITSPITETNPDSNFPTYTFTLTKYLVGQETTNTP